MQLWQSRLRAESSCVAAPGCRPPPSLLLACNAVVLLCSGRTRPPHSAMPGPSTAKQAAAAPLFVKSHRADWPLPPARDPTQPAESRAVQTLERSQPRRRGSPRGGRSGQKLSGGSWGSPSGGGRTETPRKNSSGRTAPAQLALPASRCCTELRPSQGRILGQNKFTKCREGQIQQCQESQNPVSTPKASRCEESGKEEGWVRVGGGWSVQPHLVEGVQQSHRTAAGCTSPPAALSPIPCKLR